MDIEGIDTQEFVGNDATHIAKGKRTKRSRLLSPCGVAATATVMTSSSESASGDNHVNGTTDYGSFSSTTTGTDQEEEDMANCLILLAQGGGGGGSDSHDHHHKNQVEDHDHGVAIGNSNKTEKGTTSIGKFAEMANASATTTGTKVGFYIYECKTCNRTFPSFQALGGHRASHKKPKLTTEEKKPTPPSPAPTPSPSPPKLVTNYDQPEEAGQPHIKNCPPISLQLGSHNHRSAFHGNKAKVHECSICGSEFTSGQALGGHMRRHRASSTNGNTQAVGMVNGIDTSSKATTTATTVAEVQPRNILQLDLNLPAPEDDLRDSKFQFTATQKSMVLSAAPALVDCHY